MDLGQQVVLISVSQNLLNLIKQTVIKYSDTDPVGINYISENPSKQDQTIGEAIVGRMLECIFTWACWHYKNSNGTKTRFFLAFEGCLREGVEFPEEEKFIYFQREEIFKFQGKAGFQAVLYLEDLVDLQFQVSETKLFLENQFQLSESSVDQGKLSECLAYYEEILKDQDQKQLDHFFPEDKLIYEAEMWYVEKVVPKFRNYKNKKITFQEFKLSIQDFIVKHEDHKKKQQSTANKNVSQNQSNVATNRSQVESFSAQQPSQQVTSQSVSNQSVPSQSVPAQQVNKQQDNAPKQSGNQSSAPTNRTVEQSQQQSNKMQSENNDSKSVSRPPQQSSVNQSVSGTQRNNQLQQVDEEQVSVRKSSVDKKNDGGQRQPYQNTYQENLNKIAIDDLKQEQQKQLNQKEEVIKDLERQIEHSNNEMSSIRLQNQQQEVKIDSLEQQVQEYRLQSMAQKNQNSQKTNEEILRLQQKVNEQNDEKDKLKQKITFMQNQLEESEKERLLLQSKKHEKELEVNQLNNRIQELENVIEVQTENARNSEGRIYEIIQEKENELKVEKFNLEQENNQLRAFAEELQARVEEFENDKEVNQQQLNRNSKNFEEQQHKLILENEQQKNLIEQLQQMVAEEEEKANQLQREYHQILIENKTLKEDLNTARSSQNKVSQDTYNLQILENQIQNLNERNKELEYQLEQAELHAGAAPSQLSHDYYERSSYQQRVQDYDTKINQLQSENHNIPMLQQKINELERLINHQQKNDVPITKEQEMQYSQIKKVLAETIEKSKQLDTQLNTYIQRKHQAQQQQQAYQAQRSSSAQNFRNNAPQNFYRDNDNQREDYDNKYASTQQLRRGDYQHNSSKGFDYDVDLRHYSTQPNFFPNRGGESQKLRLSQLNNMKFGRLNGMASTTGFQNFKDQFSKRIEQQVVDDSLALPEKYEEEESQMNQSVASLNDIRDLRQIDKVGADLIFPFRNPKMYYSNKAKLKNTKGKLIYYDDSLFSYMRYPKETLYKFKRSCLKWKFSIFENEDLQIGQISSSDVINNQYIVKFGLYLTNKTDIEMTNLTINYLHSNKVQMWKDQQILMTQLSGKKQLKQSLTVVFTQIPYEVIVADVEYRCHGFNQKFQVPIPCLITKYLEIQELENAAQFKSLWQEVSKFNLISSDDCSVNRQIAKSPQDFHNYFPHFINLNPEKASQYHLGLSEYILGGQVYLRQPNVTFMLKIYLKPNNMIQFRVASGSEQEDRNVVEFFMQNLLYLYTNQ